jgi:hypothetical protein
MRLMIDTRDIDRALLPLRDMPRMLRASAAVALTATAVKVREAQQREMRDVFDRPTPYTLNSLFLRSARVGDASPEASVGIKDDFGGSRSAAAWLRWQIKGGQRRLKAYERLLVGAGAMRSEDRSVPGKGARLDAFGNISRGQLMQILSQLRIDTTQGSTRKLTQYAFEDTGKERRLKRNKIRRAYGKAGGRYIAFPKGRGRLKPGIYLNEGRNFGARLGYGNSSRMVPVLLFVGSTSYEATYDFNYVAQLAVGRHLLPELRAAVAKGLAMAATPRGQA